ncbi:hypothetical protein ACIBO5_02610 [Nonomuraea angiospora]|uniref:hypothetical protein n=1 Tax=Nonomuraea angiospora TaxID=46172 RepID=UPI0037AAD735
MSDAALCTGAFSGRMRNAEPTAMKRGPLLITALSAAAGGAAIYLAPLAAVWRGASDGVCGGRRPPRRSRH